jgi:hypothetical protein
MDIVINNINVIQVKPQNLKLAKSYCKLMILYQKPLTKNELENPFKVTHH